MTDTPSPCALHQDGLLDSAYLRDQSVKIYAKSESQYSEDDEPDVIETNTVLACHLCYQVGRIVMLDGLRVQIGTKTLPFRVQIPKSDDEWAELNGREVYTDTVPEYSTVGFVLQDGSVSKSMRFITVPHAQEMVRLRMFPKPLLATLEKGFLPSLKHGLRNSAQKIDDSTSEPESAVATKSSSMISPGPRFGTFPPSPKAAPVPDNGGPAVIRSSFKRPLVVPRASSAADHAYKRPRSDGRRTSYSPMEDTNSTPLSLSQPPRHAASAPRPTRDNDSQEVRPSFARQGTVGIDFVTEIARMDAEAKAKLSAQKREFEEMQQEYQRRLDEKLAKQMEANRQMRELLDSMDTDL